LQNKISPQRQGAEKVETIILRGKYLQFQMEVMWAIYYLNLFGTAVFAIGGVGGCAEGHGSVRRGSAVLTGMVGNSEELC
jgi:hypothetical protein